jgi:hypothetical protein
MRILEAAAPIDGQSASAPASHRPGDVEPRFDKDGRHGFPLVPQLFGNGEF